MKKTLILGASLHKERYANMAIKRLKDLNFWVVGIGSVEGNINGVNIYSHEISIDDIHTVSIYLNPGNQVGYYDYVIKLNPKRVIFNPGAENKAFETLLTQHRIPFERSCTLVLLSTGQF